MTKPEDKNLKKSNGETAPQYYNEQSKQWSFSKGDQNGQNVHDQKLVSKLQELKSTIENQDDGSDEVVAGILGDIKNQLESIPETQQVNDSTKIDELTKLQSIIDVNNPVPSLSGIMNFIQGRWPVDYSEHPIKAIVVDPTDGDKDYGFVPQTEYDEHVGDESHLTDAQRQQIADVVNKANNEELKALSVMLNSYMERRDNPNQVTKTQVGLGSVDNVKQATKQEFDSHVGDVTHLTAEQRELIGNVNRKVSATDFYAHKNDNTHLTAEQRQKLEGDFSGGVTSYNDLTDVPNTFTPSAHDHGISQLSDFRINSQSGNLQFYDGVGWRNTDFINYDDNSGSPGARFLIAGTMDAGYFGIVPATELWTGAQLATAVGISQGTLQHSDTDWLKFAYEGKILFRPIKAFRHSISWNAINSANCVYGGSGGRTVTKDGKQYRVRLMRGAITDPSKNQDSDRGAHGSEWNRLMLPIHDQVRSGNWSYPAYVESGIPDWGIGFTDVDLVTHQTHGNGSYVLCQETLGSVIGSRIYRGRGGVSDSGWGAPSVADTTRGWAPVLELIQ